MLSTPLFASVKTLCFAVVLGWGVGLRVAALGLGVRKHSQAINNSGLRHPVIINRLPVFTEKEEMTSGDRSRDLNRKKGNLPI